MDLDSTRVTVPNDSDSSPSMGGLVPTLINVAAIYLIAALFDIQQQHLINSSNIK